MYADETNILICITPENPQKFNSNVFVSAVLGAAV
ncbi:hypothetical protein UFOVP1492_1 [uncultured Caudovirales phage]|uniref:Uncharacterized protein n=1 Tax=uncultured Caudovirales phage TaxID=2100421 RepID=A0A6J7XMD3_9CAUD|nr:hypothetical protein UFOVP1127_133 [uncultured Caudovirales phage]CAB4193428.1 hypothetical protein UFOVP1242_77 [uncultured Caudovirales phage]CAB4216941.1 hypothetical protein UFOVP1492_1 [uncultured Caudovirales phage]CAB5231181.1 hypothetical protein UFOVP1580_30 [uncultured Caudovirales phage]